MIDIFCEPETVDGDSKKFFGDIKTMDWLLWKKPVQKLHDFAKKTCWVIDYIKVRIPGMPLIVKHSGRWKPTSIVLQMGQELILDRTISSTSLYISGHAILLKNATVTWNFLI